MAYKAVSEATERPYEAPVLVVLGAASDLTQGPNGGPQVDLTFPHHTSGA